LNPKKKFCFLFVVIIITIENQKEYVLMHFKDTTNKKQNFFFGFKFFHTVQKIVWLFSSSCNRMADDDMDALRAQVAALQDRIGVLQDATPVPRTSEFVDNWWTPIKGMCPDDFLGSQLNLDPWRPQATRS
jgi:hypothetical protein